MDNNIFDRCKINKDFSVRVNFKREIESLKHNNITILTPLKEDITVFRGISSEFYQKLNNQGDSEVFDKAFVSVSSSAISSSSFSRGDARVLFKINVPKGKKILNVGSNSRYSHEHELLLPTDARYKITDTQKATKASRGKYGGSIEYTIVSVDII